MDSAARSNGAKSQADAHESTLEELEEELARLKQIQKQIQAVREVEGFTDERPLVEQMEERLRELREQLAQEQGHSIEPSVEPKKPEEENE